MKNYLYQLLTIHVFNEVMQIKIHTSESSVPQFSSFEVDIAIEYLKSYKLPGSDQILAELFQAGGSTLSTQVNALIHSTWNEVELPHNWRDCIIVQIYKKGNKTNCNIYRVISLLPPMSMSTVSRLTPYDEENIGYHQCGFQCNRSITDQIFCIHQIPEKGGNINCLYILSWSITQ
jgi:hypothetical protein